MANEMHLQILLSGVDQWNSWYKKELRGPADLRLASLRCGSLVGANLSHANLEGADLRYSNLQGADLRKANFTGTRLERANLRGARLGDAVGLTKEQVHFADGNEATELPARVPRPAHWTMEGMEEFLTADPAMG